jgi:hypothetical protein
LIYRGKIGGRLALFSGGILLVRKLAAVAVAAAVLLSVAGCSFNPAPESLQSYAPSDGSGIDFHPDRNQQVDLRNFLVLTNGTTYELYGSVINGGTKAQQVSFQVDGDNTKTQTIDVAANSVEGFGYAGSDGVVHKSELALSGKVGALLKLEVSVGGRWQAIEVPVLDGTISYYKDLVAGFASAAPVAPTATPVASPSASPSN